MIDPLSPLTAPPPRYLLESDSSDEEGQGVYGGHHASRTSPAPGPRVQVLPLGDDPLPAVDSVVVGVGQAGKYLLRRAGARQAVLEVELDGHRLGAAFVVPGGLFIGLHDADKGDAAFSVVQELTTLVKAKNWTVFSSYVPSMYIPDAAEGLISGDSPVRVLGREAGKLIRTYDAPNYVTGIAGAFLSAAAHPAFPLHAASVALYLLPLPLSQFAPTGLTEALTTLPAELGQAFARHALWTDADDEPFQAPGMGKRKIPETATPAGGDLGGMYM